MLLKPGVFGSAHHFCGTKWNRSAVTFPHSCRGSRTGQLPLVKLGCPRGSRIQSFNDGRFKVGPVEIRDEGLNLLVKAKGLQLTIAKTDAWKYTIPVAGLALVGISGAIFLGPAILSLLFVGGLILASVSAFSAVLVSLLILPVIAVTLVAFTSALSGIAAVATTAATIAAIWFLGGTMITTAFKSEESQAINDKSEDEREGWMKRMDAEQENIDRDLLSFDRKLASKERKKSD